VTFRSQIQTKIQSKIDLDFYNLKVAQINYVSRNQLQCTANLNFGKTLLGFVNKLFISVQLIFFLDHVLLLAELAQKFKILQNSCIAK
jgi:hypothetical protein